MVQTQVALVEDPLEAQEALEPSDMMRAMLLQMLMPLLPATIEEVEEPKDNSET